MSVEIKPKNSLKVTYKFDKLLHAFNELKTSFNL